MSNASHYSRKRGLSQRLKPRSSVMRTTLVVGIVVIVSQVLSIAFFWQNLYLPEIKQHAHTAALRLESLRMAEETGQPSAAEIDDEILRFGNMSVIRDPSKFPTPVPKWFAELFTNRFEKQIQFELEQSAQVYFEFKPTPTLWIKAPTKTPMWVSEELVFIQQYSPGIIIGWVLGVPLLSILAIVVLARQLNRPLKRLQLAAIRVGRGLHSTHLDEFGGPTEIRAVNRAFNQMTQQIRQAEHERTIMLAGISHDLRTPLTRMRLSAELMGDPELSEGMVSDVEDMDAILDQFISFMRDGSEEPNTVASLNALILDVAHQFQAQIDIKTDLGDISAVTLKHLSFKRVLANLIQNALNYGRGPIELSTREENDHIVFTCRDHGHGIDVSRADELLQPFQRGESARTTQGSGLGLAIVARIVRQHYGRLHLRNHVEGGLEVVIELPRAGQRLMRQPLDYWNKPAPNAPSAS